MARVFAHAVASFEPTSEGVLVWTRLGGGHRSAEWLVARGPDLKDVVASGVAETGPGRDFTITVDVGGLQAATTYWYRFAAGGEESPIGRTRTLPTDGASRVRLGTVSCARYSVAPLGVYRALAEREVDLVLHLGDYIYEDDGADGARAHEPPREALSLQDYRQRLAQVRADPDAQALHLRHPVVTIWDDHDLADNASKYGAKHHDPEVHGAWSERVRAAATARQEWLPARLRDPRDVLTTWRSFQIADLAEVLLLDTRIAGRDRHAGDEGARPLHDPARSMLGHEQRTWLCERLSDTEGPWALVASSVVMSDLQLAWLRPFQGIGRLLPNGYAVADGCLLRDDQWDGYPAERDQIASWMRQRGESGGRTVVLSGDVHASFAFEGPCESERPVAVEFTTPAVSSAAMGRAPAVGALLDRAIAKLAHVRWADVSHRGYCLLDITPEAVTSSWWFADPYAADPGRKTSLGAAYRVDRASWPPVLAPAVVPADLQRPGAPGETPARPSDLQRLRLRKRARTAAKAASAAGALTAIAARARRRILTV